MQDSFIARVAQRKPNRASLGKDREPLSSVYRTLIYLPRSLSLPLLLTASLELPAAVATAELPPSSRGGGCWSNGLGPFILKH